MDDNLLLEVKGRSLKLFAYDLEKKVQERIDSDLVAFAVRADREGITPKQRTLQMKAIIDIAMSESEDAILTAAANDVRSNLKLADKHLS